MHKIMMCPPIYFGVHYEINPWMDVESWKKDEAQRALAASQSWDNLFRALDNAGAELYLQAPNAKVPDLVFTANAAVVLNNKAILASFKHPERQLEEPLNQAYFEQLGIAAEFGKAKFEGAGDALFDEPSQTMFVGYGQRSDIDAVDDVKNILGCKAEALELVDPYYYHLDTCFCPTDLGFVLYYPAAFSTDAQQKLKDMIGERLIAVSDEDAKRFACNAVSIHEHIVMPPPSAAFQKQLEDKGFNVHAVALDSYLLSGGSAKCLTLRLNQKSA